MRIPYISTVLAIIALFSADVVLAQQASVSAVPKIDNAFAKTQCERASNPALQARLRSMGYAWCDIAIDVATLSKDDKLLAQFTALKQQAQKNLDAQSQQAARELYKQLRVNVGLDGS